MIPIDFEGSNLVLNKPINMTDEQCTSGVPAFKSVDNDGIPFIMVAFAINKEERDAVAKGGVICLKQCTNNFVPSALFVCDEKGAV
jgi:hypothetical protein